MDYVANAEINEDRGMTYSRNTPAFRDMTRVDASAMAPTPSDLARVEKIAFVVAAIMMLAPLAAAAWGAFFPA